MNIYKALQALPVIGTILYIANSYAYGGDVRASSEFAPFSRWCRALLIPIFIASMLAAATVWQLVVGYLPCVKEKVGPISTFAAGPGELIHAVMPSLLGFGIGVYALLFALAGAFVADLHGLIETQRKEGKRKQGSVMLLSADMAYPLVVLVVVLALGVLQRIIPENPVLIVIAWSAFWYGLIVSVELIGVLFGLGNQALLQKLEEKTKIDVK